jgi:hypothetical protein
VQFLKLHLFVNLRINSSKSGVEQVVSLSLSNTCEEPLQKSISSNIAVYVDQFTTGRQWWNGYINNCSSYYFFAVLVVTAAAPANENATIGSTINFKICFHNKKINNYYFDLLFYRFRSYPDTGQYTFIF